MSKILIIEDEKPQRVVLREFLTKQNLAVIEASNGIEGLNVALTNRPDVIILDIRMPRMDGMTTMHKLRQDEWGKNVPIIILTNYDSDDAQIYQISVDQPAFYLIKSNSSLELVLEKISEVLKPN